MPDNIKQILVVDDDKGTAELFTEMLQVSGYQVSVCFDGQQAIDYLKETRPDVIVMDMIMPVHSGMDLLNHLQQNYSSSSNGEEKPIPVVVVSSRGLPLDIKKAIQAGANFYLTKPVSFLDLKQAVENALELSIT
ncbi:MAG TPA: response regulator [Anaerolineales bacterium]|nr:response regulator [Anaerolineales bacterium]